MKLINSFLVLPIVIVLFGCKNPNVNNSNSFSTISDTLLIRTEKHKGDGFTVLGAMPIEFKNRSEEFPYAIKYPEQLQNAERFLLETDFKEKQPFYVDIIKGFNNGNQVFVVDENNNKDLSDDQTWPIEKMKWDSTENLVKCTYKISNGNNVVTDSSWLKIGLVNNRLYVGRSEHLIGKFKIEDHNYEIGIIEFRNARSFTYGIDSETVLLAQSGTRKDSVKERDLRKLGEFLKLNDTYYKFDSISNNGEFVRLVKEENIISKTGMQIGMIAPTFEVVTTKGDTISSKSLNNKITVIANSCGCGGDIESTEAYYAMKNNFKNINILHADSKIDTHLDGFHIDIENKFNHDFYKNYRMQYCSRLCYVIGKDNRILDLFFITDWKNYLPEIVKE